MKKVLPAPNSLDQSPTQQRFQLIHFVGQGKGKGKSRDWSLVTQLRFVLPVIVAEPVVQSRDIRD